MALRLDTAGNALRARDMSPVSIAEHQDGRVRALRRLVQAVRATASMEMAMNPAAGDIAKEVRALTEKVLRNPHSYEKFVVW